MEGVCLGKGRVRVSKLLEVLAWDQPDHPDRPPQIIQPPASISAHQAPQPALPARPAPDLARPGVVGPSRKAPLL